MTWSCRKEFRYDPRALDVLNRLPELQARRIGRTVRLLKTFPQIGAPVQYPGMTNLRRILAGGRAIVYSHDAGQDMATVVIVRPPRVGWGDLVD